MSQLPKQLSVQRADIERFRTVEEVKLWLVKFMKEFDSLYTKLYDWTNNVTFSDGVEFLVPGNLPGEDDNWRIIIEGANLEFQKRISGSWDVVFTIDG